MSTLVGAKKAVVKHGDRLVCSGLCSVPGDGAPCSVAHTSGETEVYCEFP